MVSGRQAGLIALDVIMIVIPTVAVALRCWGMAVIKNRKVGWDDYTAIAGLPFCLTLNAMLIWWILYAFNPAEQGVEDSLRILISAAKVLFGGEYIFLLSIAIPKFSALFFYNRIFSDTSRTFRALLWIIGTLNMLWLIGGIFAAIFQCHPLKKAFLPLTPGECFSQWAWFFWTALTEMIIDVLILILPLPRLWKLRMPNSKKAVVILTFLSAYSVVICSILRAIVTAEGMLHPATSVPTPMNSTAHVALLATEAPVCVMSVSLPIIFSLFKRIRKHGFRYALNRSTSADSTNSPTDPNRRPSFMPDLAMKLPSTNDSIERTLAILEKQYTRDDNEHGSFSTAGNDNTIERSTQHLV